MSGISSLFKTDKLVFLRIILLENETNLNGPLQDSSCSLP